MRSSHWLLRRETHSSKVEHVGHGGHGTGLAWGASGCAIRVTSLHHLLLSELCIQELDLLLLVHHDVLVDQLLLVGSHLGRRHSRHSLHSWHPRHTRHSRHSRHARISSTWRHHRILHHACEPGHQVVHARGSLLLLLSSRCKVRLGRRA